MVLCLKYSYKYGHLAEKAKKDTSARKNSLSCQLIKQVKYMSQDTHLHLTRRLRQEENDNVNTQFLAITTKETKVVGF